jgi:hypothetical protein
MIQEAERSVDYKRVNIWIDLIKDAFKDLEDKCRLKEVGFQVVRGIYIGAMSKPEIDTVLAYFRRAGLRIMKEEYLPYNIPIGLTREQVERSIAGKYLIIYRKDRE